MPALRRHLDVKHWRTFQHVVYLLFMVSEGWVVAYVLAKTDGSTAFLFTNTLTAMVIAVSAFLSSGRTSPNSLEEGLISEK